MFSVILFYAGFFLKYLMLRILVPCEAELRGRHSQAGAWERGEKRTFFSRSQTLFGNAFLEALLRMGTRARNIS